MFHVAHNHALAMAEDRNHGTRDCSALKPIDPHVAYPIASLEALRNPLHRSNLVLYSSGLNKVRKLLQVGMRKMNEVRGMEEDSIESGRVLDLRSMHI